MLPRYCDHQQASRGVVVSRNNEGQTIGKFNHNPVLNTKLYEVMFPDGLVHQYMANTIAESIYYQLDEYCHRYQLMYRIIIHKSDGRAFPKSEAFTVSRNRNRARKQTTKGWYLEVKWKYGTNAWVPLREMKESHGIQTAAYAESNELVDEPTLAWCPPFTLKKKDKLFPG